MQVGCWSLIGRAALSGALIRIPLGSAGQDAIQDAILRRVAHPAEFCADWQSARRLINLPHSYSTLKSFRRASKFFWASG
jgi:hypothetical protein